MTAEEALYGLLLTRHYWGCAAGLILGFIFGVAGGVMLLDGSDTEKEWGLIVYPLGLSLIGLGVYKIFTADQVVMRYIAIMLGG